MRTIRICVAAGALLWALAGCDSRSPTVSPSGASAGLPGFTATLPQDIQGQDSPDAVERGRAAATFSWQTFVALQWPAKTGSRGVPGDFAQGNGPRVWETWKEPYEVYLPEGKTPQGWEVLVPPPGYAPPGNQKVLVRVSKATEFLNEKVQATQADATLPPILTDQRGRLVRYEIRMNRTVFDHILQQQLYDGNVQARTDAVSYPDGACLLKAAWKELEPEEGSRYITADCWIPEGGKLRLQRMGLVGFHLMVKTPSAPQWVWATFEQRDNLAGTHPSFRNPARSAEQDNLQTAAGVPTQVSRLVPIPDWLRSFNAEVQARLASQGSPLQYYELVETQRPVPGSQPSGEPPTVFSVEPPWLSNTTQETFIQKSSCMGCHAMAGTLNPGEFVSGDFTFTLTEAYPKPPQVGVVALPAQPESEWEVEHWTELQRAGDLVEHTYERLPQNVGGKLHCASCHLDGGANSRASWWVGMTKAYDYPATDGLQKRIDRCFTHSMNGTALSGTPSGDADMAALISYMQWLDRRSGSARIDTNVRGFPEIADRTGSAEHGQQLYEQKCTYCHGSDGGGRYLSQTYFRPAVWGQHSWPHRAGLGTSKTLAAFLKANMPLGSGGLLTEQEAWDLAVFLNSQSRP